MEINKGGGDDDHQRADTKARKTGEKMSTFETVLLLLNLVTDRHFSLKSYSY